VLRKSLFSISAALVLVAGPLAAQGPKAKVGGADARTFEIKMIEVTPTKFEFSPDSITVRQGDIVRFTQTKVNAHNMVFKVVPAGVDLGDLKEGPYMLAVEQVHQFTIDKRFVPGTYNYTCTPHEVLGMKGRIIVVK